MSEHTLPTGKRLIRGLSELGSAMGYNVRREFPVISNPSGSPLAVDVAWFGDESQVYPLMIFEVETRGGNAIASNPLKVFAQDTKQFEKPLFYFQLVVHGASTSRRTELLERQYGNHNYRLYRLVRDEGTQLILDILRQHRRIRDEVDLVAVYEILTGSNWSKFVDPMAFLDEARALRLSERSQIAAFIHLARTHRSIRKRLPRLIRESYGKLPRQIDSPKPYSRGG